MAITGLSTPIVGKYTHDGNGKVTYSDPIVADALVEYSAEFESSENNDFYADNRVKETAAGRFTNGTLAITTADLPPKLSKLLVGLKEVQRQLKEKQITEIVMDDDQKSPDVGYGVIEEHQNDGVTSYLPIWFPRVRFNIPSGAATTRGEEIDWQTKQISGRIMRSEQDDENYKHPWQISPAETMETEDEAKEYLMAVLGKTDEE